MKKKFLFLTALLSAAMFTCIFAACGDNQAERQVVYQVRFNDNYDGNVTKVEVNPNQTVTLIEEPVRTGYIFKGWYLGSDDINEEKFDETTPINGDVTLYAKWERDTSLSLVTLKYLNYTSLDDVFAVTKGGTFTKPANPVYDENEMYTFVNWYTDKECTNVYDFSSSVNSDITLYAGWVQAKTYVTFDANYAGCGENQKVVVPLNSTVAQADNPVRDQYEFGGWYTGSVYGEEYDFSQPVTGQLKLYAHWLRSEYSINFNVNGATLASGIANIYSLKSGASAESIAEQIQSNMTYEGHDFAGWYKVAINPDAEEDTSTDEQKADLTSIADDMVVYAKWVLKEYQIDFDYNFENAPAAPQTQSVKYGKLATQPDRLEREGYIFGGWYTDANYTEQFAFDKPVTSSYTLYAKWIDNTEEHSDVTVTYYVNTTGSNTQYAQSVVAFGGTADSAQDKPENPSVTDYYFAGWYEDEAFTKEFSMSKILDEDISIYAKMLKKYTFEAEATDFTEKFGQGTSTNSYEEGMIMDYTFVKDGSTQTVSNGYFVRELYYNGASLDFQIEAAEEVFDAVLYLRVSSESYEFFTTKEKDGVTYNYLSDTEFKIVVNGEWDGATPTTWLNYGGLYMPMANIVDREDLAQNKTPFEDVLITVNLHLVKGSNTITLYVDNNNSHGGTYHAEAPIIDCIYIYSSTELTMYDYEFYTRDNVNRG